ncbi:glycosyltransferase family 4 protein [Pseudonocardia parietis]|uniref:Glycosyltransferase involved in cell wall biosynthesis n=1 Tax=Pseudonocardia parietis TaxID=570936 RepID=A0ABS4VQQ2_9PSEU|nr:glycosyltransferase family 1 protein [Pseudonocardia parietis]MBP2366241.1 glycosyltransferase involved in cell wall biosynthesis [Pseudonocardia parietis]
MRILVDCRYIRPGKPDGIGRYTTGLVRALDRLHPVELLVSDPRQRDGLPDRPAHTLPAPTGAGEPFVARKVNRLLEGSTDAVVFSPMQTMGTLGRRYAVVLTVHDLIYYRHPAPPPWLAAPVRAIWRAYHLSWWPQRLLLSGADAVAVVSRATGDLVAAHRLTRRRVAVVPDATDFHLPAGAEPRTRPGGNRLVYAGSFMPYKNVAALARAAALLPGHELHFVSPVPPGVRSELERLAAPARPVFHDGVDDAGYRALLDGATALVSASRDEGFGLPVLEAMARGCPVVVSGIPAFREVAGDAGLFADPDDPAGFAEAVRSLDPEAAWTARSEQVRARAAAQTWDGAAEALLEVLEQAVARRRG